MEEKKVMTYRRAAGSDMIKLGVSGIGPNIGFVLVMMYLLMFYTDYLGINPIVVGSVFLVARIIDAVSDPLMGVIADRFSTRIGKYRPWIIFGAPILGLSIILLFSAPNLSATGKVVYVYTTYIFFSLVATVVNVPYNSLNAVVTEDPDQRTTIVTLKQVFSTIAQVWVLVLAIPITNVFGGNARAWQIFALMTGILLTVAFWFSAWGSKKYDTPSKQTDKPAKVPLLKQLSLITKNKALLLLLIANVTDLIALACTNAMVIYFAKNVLGNNLLLPVASAIGLPMVILFSVFMPFISRKMGKKNFYLMLVSITIVTSISTWFIPWNWKMVILIKVGFEIALRTVINTMGWSLLADCADYGQSKTGIKGIATVSSAYSFFGKLGVAIGGFLVGFIISVSGYIPPVKEIVEGITVFVEQTQTLYTMKVITGTLAFVPALGYIFSLVAMWFYPITKDYYAKMKLNMHKQQIADNESMNA